MIILRSATQKITLHAHVQDEKSVVLRTVLIDAGERCPEKDILVLIVADGLLKMDGTMANWR